MTGTLYTDGIQWWVVTLLGIRIGKYNGPAYAIREAQNAGVAITAWVVNGKLLSGP